MAVVKLRLDAQNAQLSFLIRNVVRLSPNFHGSHGEMLATPPIFLFSFGHVILKQKALGTRMPRGRKRLPKAGKHSAHAVRRKKTT